MLDKLREMSKSERLRWIGNSSITDGKGYRTMTLLDPASGDLETWYIPAVGGVPLVINGGLVMCEHKDKAIAHAAKWKMKHQFDETRNRLETM